MQRKPPYALPYHMDQRTQIKRKDYIFFKISNKIFVMRVIEDLSHHE